MATLTFNFASYMLNDKDGLTFNINPIEGTWQGRGTTRGGAVVLGKVGSAPRMGRRHAGRTNRRGRKPVAETPNE